MWQRTRPGGACKGRRTECGDRGGRWESITPNHRWLAWGWQAGRECGLPLGRRAAPPRMTGAAGQGLKVDQLCLTCPHQACRSTTTATSCRSQSFMSLFCAVRVRLSLLLTAPSLMPGEQAPPLRLTARLLDPVRWTRVALAPPLPCVAWRRQAGLAWRLVCPQLHAHVRNSAGARRPSCSRSIRNPTGRLQSPRLAFPAHPRLCRAPQADCLAMSRSAFPRLDVQP